MYIDTHSHLFEDKIDLHTVRLDDLDKVIVPTYKLEHFDRVRLFCEQNPKCFLSVGVHPEYVSSFDEAKFLEFVSRYRKEIVAIGEIGLDTKYAPLAQQIDCFTFQLGAAMQFDLPISVHLRGAVWDTFFEIMQKYTVACVLHCFSGGEAELKKAIERGYMISFAANITYKANEQLRKLARLVPDENLVIETDSPSMAPSGFPRGHPNTSENISYVASTLARVRNTTIENIAAITSKNAEKIFFGDKK